MLATHPFIPNAVHTTFPFEKVNEISTLMYIMLQPKTLEAGLRELKEVGKASPERFSVYSQSLVQDFKITSRS